MDSFLCMHVLVIGSIFTTSIESSVQFTTPYNGQVIKGLLNSSVTFSWTFNGDFDVATWGLKSRDTNDVNVTLVSLTKAGLGSISIPSSYVGRVSGGWDNKISPGKVTFTLSLIQLQDSAFYACMVRPSDVLASTIQDYLELAVEDPPKAFPDEQVKSVDVGDSATFTLSARGTPPPNITWYRNGTRVSGSQYKVIKFGSNSSQLTIKNVSPADYGYYDCHATSNGMKPATARFFLGVLKPVQEDGVLLKPTVEAQIGEQVALYCPVSGYPPPEVEWTFDGVKLKKSLSKALVKPSVKKNDYGSYLCTARSLEETVGPFSITLSQANSSVIKDVPSKMEIGLGDKFEWETVPALKAVEYYVKISGEVEDTELIGEKNSLEIVYSSLKIKDESRKGEPVKVNIEVFAFVESSIIGKGGPFSRMILSGATTPKVSFVSIFLLCLVGHSLQ